MGRVAWMEPRLEETPAEMGTQTSAGANITFRHWKNPTCIIFSIIPRKKNQIAHRLKTTDKKKSLFILALLK